MGGFELKTKRSLLAHSEATRHHFGLASVIFIFFSFRSISSFVITMYKVLSGSSTSVFLLHCLGIRQKRKILSCLYSYNEIDGQMARPGKV